MSSQKYPPYPLTPEEREEFERQQRLAEESQIPDSDSSSLHEISATPAFDLTPLRAAIDMKVKQPELPDALKVGTPPRKDAQRTSAELPEVLRPGSGRKVSEQRPGPAPASASDTSSTPELSANLSTKDRPFSDYSPFYVPPASESTSPKPQVYVPPPPPPPPVPVPQIDGMNDPIRPSISTENKHGDQQRQDSVASTASDASSVFYPGADMSGLDASSSRALPGYRGAPAVGQTGWQASAPVETTARTWEEDLELRAQAGAELQRRAEEARQRAQQEALEREYSEHWNQNENPKGPALPPKQFELLEVRGPMPTAVTVPEGELISLANTPTHETHEPPAEDIPPVAQPMVSPPAEQARRSPVIDPSTEIYNIKHVNLVSPITGALHKFPILLQNLNGPCPLMALVNAITISTPPSRSSALADVLRKREQVSLNLLVEAVFEELMSRDLPDGQDLPDVSDLFAFLIALHTGMNVNPRFNTAPGEPGAFEQTKELQLYAAFSVPLVHGWLPSPDTAHASALQRSAKSYDETQTLLFAEEELITKLTSGSNLTATDEEQKLLTDAPIIREFIEANPTQLTTYGLETLRRLPEWKPSILFRNDHFSTIIRRPNGELVALVTDMGFASHQEVVWERIADVAGRNNIFLSGDFRPVGGGGGGGGGGGNQASWTDTRPIPPHRPIQSLIDAASSPPPPPPRTSSVQQNQPTPRRGSGSASVATISAAVAAAETDGDYDLALAMQLQEEENEAQRRRQQGRNERPELPPRRIEGQTPPPPYDASSQRHGVGAGSADWGGNGRTQGARMEGQQRGSGRRGANQRGRLEAPGDGGRRDKEKEKEKEKEEKCVVM
ncbi:hypothetical protein BZA77DRAFT_260007 [Pyronema omphalodes]|nr:hypothetical protein BZA77DRAFT_260007 [Pyronema omphalodes]